MFSSTSRFLKSFCGFGAQTCPFDMMKVRGHHPTSYTITLNQSHYGILVYSGRCRTLDRSCPQFNCVCVFSWLNLHDKQTCLSLPSASLPGRVLSANQSLAWESRSAYSSALFAEELQGNPTAKPPSWLGFCVFLVLRVSNLWRE